MKKECKILVIDGQGGGVGKAIVEKLREHFPELHIVACGTNVIATNAMLKAGADEGATGPSAIVYNAEKADIILGVMGIVIPFSMLGEYTSEMAEAVSKSDAKKILIPMQKCNIRLAVPDAGNLSNALSTLIEAVREELEA
ncbi:DUF3842 family protein [Clostridiales bacterium COT073_COT-073]|nr:DUF3842 family protein [Clostridiales bacterium COT073_COT-073]